MSGHNKWSKVKNVKGPADLKRAKIFTKLLREIQVATRFAGGDPRNNPRLRDAIQEARANNMPKDNIERAIKRGLGQDQDGADYEEITYEGYGPGGVALLIECLTDNRNRTVADLRALLVRNNANLVEAGSVGWMFTKIGFLTSAKNGTCEEDLMELALNAGAEDLQSEGDQWEIYSPPENLESVRSALENQRIPILSSCLTLMPKNTIEISEDAAQQILKLIDLLEELDDVKRVHSNFSVS